MRTLASCGLAILMLSGAAKAEEDSCAPVAMLAESVMSGRQHGVAMRDMVDLINKGDGGSSFKEAAKSMIILAYETPIFSSEEYQKKSISEFQNQFYLACMKKS